MLNRSLVFIFTLLTLTAAGVFGAETALSVVVNDAENRSSRLKSLKEEEKAARERALAQRAQYYPKFFLDGSYRYITDVQEISLPIANSTPVKFGDNANYSFGPALSWTAWDSGGIANTCNSFTAAAEAKKQETEAARRQIVLAARNAYFQVTLAAEQATLYSDALKLAQAQYEDIALNVKAGTKSRSDELKAHQELLSRMKQQRQAQADLTAALYDLSFMTGADYKPSNLESLDAMLLKFNSYMTAKLNEKHPSLEALLRSSEAAGYASKSSGSGHWPKLQLSVKASVDYPNGNKPESYNQNAFNAAFNWPLFEAGAVNSRVKENKSAQNGWLERREQLLSDLRRDWKKTMEQLANLEEQRKLNEISVMETEELRQIVYNAYKTGSVSFIEVENANFKALEAKINSARTKVQLLINLAAAANLAE